MDRFTLAGLQAGKKFDKRVREFHWRMYSELAFQRSEILDKIREALLKAATEKWEFQHYQRVVKYRWALKPLSAGGSLKFPGGRFNIGDLDPEFPSFPALYLAIDKETALQEVLGQDAATTGTLNPYDVALTRPDSIAVFSVSGRVQTVIDLTKPDRLGPFVALIRGFRQPRPAKWSSTYGTPRNLRCCSGRCRAAGPKPDLMTQTLGSRSRRQALRGLGASACLGSRRARGECSASSSRRGEVAACALT